MKEELLNLLGSDALDVFNAARRLAYMRGGVVSPLHLVNAGLEFLLTLSSKRPQELQTEAFRRLFTTINSKLAQIYPSSPEAILVPRETQDLIADASRLARSSGQRLASAAHLFSAAFDAVERSLPQADLPLAELNDIAMQWINASGDRADTGSITSVSGPLRSAAIEAFCKEVVPARRETYSHQIVGREREITALVEILCRKLKSNPLLIGRPGVGKTVLVTALADTISKGLVPERLKDKRIVEVSRINLLAEAKYSGEVEDRLKRLFDDVSRAGNIILFFDELHTLFGAGGPAGTGDVANLIKSALSSGEITCIGATTLAEYFKYVARDEALARRFTTISVQEPSAKETARILIETRDSFESFHRVTISDDVVLQVVETAGRYLHSRAFPDKAFDLLDRVLVKSALSGLRSVNREVIDRTVSEMTGLPLEILDSNPAERLDGLEAFLEAAVPGQNQAAREITRVIRIAKLGLDVHPERPDGVFLFIGPEGVGKVEMAAALASYLFGSSEKMIEFDMSQFSESSSLSRLIGAEPGYVGYGDRSGLLSRALQDHPHSLLLLKNIDLANVTVQQFLADAFERGSFTDACGSDLSLSNATVIMTISSVGGNHPQIGFLASSNNHAALSGRIIEPLSARVDEAIEFCPLDQDAIYRTISLRLERLRVRLEAAQCVTVSMHADLIPALAERLKRETNCLAGLDRLLQDLIILPFSRLPRQQITGSKSHIVIKPDLSGVRIEIAGGCEVNDGVQR
ncbi:MAG: hypothetical protein DMF61_10500 [Blastocatellia bacterium AA13]|nr:MAG: hypothetical protein DMF61_10500 [Blastocatellia bacterium AA13]